MFNEFQQPPATCLSKVDIATDSDGDRLKASGVASNTRLLSEVFPGGRGARHSCRHERGVTYHRSSATSACHCAPALFYIRGGRCPRDKATAIRLSVPDWGVSVRIIYVKNVLDDSVGKSHWIPVCFCLSASISSSFFLLLHFRLNHFFCLFLFSFLRFALPFPVFSFHLCLEYLFP